MHVSVGVGCAFTKYKTRRGEREYIHFLLYYVVVLVQSEEQMAGQLVHHFIMYYYNRINHQQ